jgi:predicted transcriptional regulator
MATKSWKTTVGQIEEALWKNGGWISQAAKSLGISQSAVSQRIKKSEKLQRTMREIDEYFIDLSESKLIAAIKNGEPWAIRMYLLCKGKARGYIEKQQIDANINNKEPLIIKRAGECK